MKDEKKWFWGALVAVVIQLGIFFWWECSWQAGDGVRSDPQPKPTPGCGDVVWKEPTATPAPTATHTPAPTDTPTQAPTATNTPTSAPTATNTPKPTATPLKRPENAAAGVYSVEPGHAFKPYTAYTWYTLAGSPHMALQQIAKTDKHGLRVVTDADGVERYCVAMGAAWAGGHYEHIGRCIDIVMANGHTLHCVLADTKKDKHTEHGEGLYGAGNHDLIEFIVDMTALVPAAARMGDCSFCGEEFVGDAVEVRVFDKYIAGFGK